MSDLTSAEKDAVDAAAFRRLLSHLDENQDVQNIDLMILANFCRNCLSKWWLAEAEDRGHDVDLDDARRRVYGMDYKTTGKPRSPRQPPNKSPPITPARKGAENDL